MPTRQTEALRQHVEHVGLSLEGRVHRIHDALDGLAWRTAELFTAVTVPDGEARAWIAREGFALQESGFYERTRVIERARAEGKLHDEPVLCWGGASRDREETVRRCWLLQRLVPQMRALHQRFPGVAYLYFQDAEDPHLAMVIPGFSPETVIPSDFRWHTYHSFTIAEPGVNPERAVRWSPPNIDYADQGLIACVSQPVWEGDRFLGVWTLDVPLRALHSDLQFEGAAGLGGRHVTFLADYDGRLLLHPSIDPERQGEKGALYDVKLGSLGGDYATLDLAALAAEGSGHRELLDASGTRVLLSFRAVPALRWLVLSSVPAEDLVEATRTAFAQAFASLGRGDLTVRLDEAVGDASMRQLVTAYNDMAAALQEAQRRREAAEREQRLLAVERERLARELEIAVAIQSAMLPERPRHPEFEFAGRVQPADEVGGDFFDVITRDDGRLWITVGDVSSHGLGSGLVMMLAQAVFRAVFEASPERDPSTLFRHVNRLLYASTRSRLGGGRHITANLLAYQGDGDFSCVGAHLWPLVVDPAGGKARCLDAAGPWLGVVPDLGEVPVQRVSLRRGEVLCLYSDGVLEARGADGTFFELDRFTRLVLDATSSAPLDQALDRILAEVGAFAPQREDDRMVLLVRRT